MSAWGSRVVLVRDGPESRQEFDQSKNLLLGHPGRDVGEPGLRGGIEFGELLLTGTTRRVERGLSMIGIGVPHEKALGGEKVDNPLDALARLTKAARGRGHRPGDGGETIEHLPPRKALACRRRRAITVRVDRGFGPRELPNELPGRSNMRHSRHFSNMWPNLDVTVHAEICRTERPPLRTLGSATVACHHTEE